MTGSGPIYTATTSPPPPLTRIGRYSVIEELATGGMSHVYLAKRDGSQEFCVVKLLRRSLQGSDVAAKRFRREAHVASFLEHPNIARVLGAGIEDGRFFIAYEFIPGQMLSSIADTVAANDVLIPTHVAVTIALIALDALSYAHSLRDADGKSMEIVHRDLSPHNIMISYRGEVKIIDFGVARGRMNTFRTNPGTIVGTPQYMSPEQVSGGDVDSRTDLYTMGAVLWEILTGRKLIPDQANRVNMFGAVLLETPVAPSVLNGHVTPDLDAVLMKALVKRPAERWQTAGEMRAALAMATRELPRAGARELGAMVEHLFPKEKKHIIALSENRLTGEHGRETLDDVLEIPTQPDWRWEDLQRSSTPPLIPDDDTE